MTGRGKRACYWIASLSLAMTRVVMTDVANGRGKRTCYWIASRFRASTLAMTGGLVMMMVLYRRGNPFFGSTMTTTGGSVNYNSSYMDIMLHKKAT